MFFLWQKLFCYFFYLLIFRAIFQGFFKYGFCLVFAAGASSFSAGIKILVGWAERIEVLLFSRPLCALPTYGLRTTG